MKHLRETLDQLVYDLKRAGQHWKTAALLVLTLLVLSVDNPPPLSMDAQLDWELTGQQFDFVTWEIKAVW